MQVTATPSLRIRFACMLYEAVLLFGVFVMTGLIFGVLMEQRHALHYRNSLSILLFFVTGVYFVWQWSRGGQTLPMKTWRLRLVGPGGGRISPVRAASRYLLTWLWFAPGLALAKLIAAEGWMLILIPAANIALWAMSGYLDPDRQLLHDRLAGTRLIRLPHSKKA